MTYCVAVKLNAGMVFLSDSRTNAGLDQISTFRKMIVYEKPGERFMTPTGIAIALPPGWEAQMRPRSGLAAKHGVTCVNSPGTIDADSRGEIKISLINPGAEDFTVRRGDRIGQMVIAPVFQARFEETEELDETARGAGGFGSTGV